MLSLLLPSSPHSSLTRGSISLFCLASISSGETGLSSTWGTLDRAARSLAESGDLESGLTAAPSAASLWALCGFPACAAGPEGAAARPVGAKSQPQEARELSCGPTNHFERASGPVEVASDGAVRGQLLELDGLVLWGGRCRQVHRENLGRGREVSALGLGSGVAGAEGGRGDGQRRQLRHNAVHVPIAPIVGMQ